MGRPVQRRPARTRQDTRRVQLCSTLFGLWNLWNCLAAEGPCDLRCAYGCRGGDEQQWTLTSLEDVEYLCVTVTILLSHCPVSTLERSRRSKTFPLPWFCGLFPAVEMATSSIDPPLVRCVCSLVLGRRHDTRPTVGRCQGHRWQGLLRRLGRLHRFGGKQL